jgi:hypothetical protein
MVIGLPESFRVNHARKFVSEFQHGIFREIGPPRVNQFVKNHVQQFFTVKRV